MTKRAINRSWSCNNTGNVIRQHHKNVRFPSEVIPRELHPENQLNQIEFGRNLSFRLFHLRSSPDITANTRRRPNVGLMLGQRRRRWANNKPTLGRRLVH